MLVQAFECVEDGNYSDALKLYDLAIEEEPDNASVLVDKGATLQNMGKLKLAKKSYDKALEIISQVRQFKSRKSQSLKTPIKLVLPEKDKKELKPFLEDLKAVTGAEEIKFGSTLSMSL